MYRIANGVRLYRLRLSAANEELEQAILWTGPTPGEWGWLHEDSGGIAAYCGDWEADLQEAEDIALRSLRRARATRQDGWANSCRHDLRNIAKHRRLYQWCDSLPLEQAEEIQPEEPDAGLLVDLPFGSEVTDFLLRSGLLLQKGG